MVKSNSFWDLSWFRSRLFRDEGDLEARMVRGSQEHIGLVRNVENNLENKILGAQQTLINELSALRRSLVTMELHGRLAMFQAVQGISGGTGAATDGAVPEPLSEPTLDATFAMLRRRYPRLFPIWHELLLAGEKSYRSDPVASVSVYDNSGAVTFRSFCFTNLKGTTLDIGCGPVAVPIYLDGYDLRLVAGIDPFGSSEMHPFAFARAVAEQIPWQNESFDTVVAATSLDHFIDLDLGLQEISRILKPKGELIVWVSFVSGAPKYDPSSSNTKKIDEFHLFHFDRLWFLDLIKKSFFIKEEINLDGFSHFYRLGKTEYGESSR